MAVKSSRLPQNTALYIITGIAFVTIILWYIMPMGRLFLYPFVILSTWFHEMGHGLTALILGGSFHKLEIVSSGSGVAYWSGDVFGGDLGKAMIALAGPVAPTIVGAFFLLMSSQKSKRQRSRMINLIFSIFMIICDIIWIRTLFGAFVIGAFSVAFFCSAVWGTEKFNSVVLQFIAVQALMSIYMNIGYFFTGIGTGEDGIYYSDTYVVSQCLILPYWFWGCVVTAFSVLSIVFCYKKLISGSAKR